jgi:hypothetical protein
MTFSKPRTVIFIIAAAIFLADSALPVYAGDVSAHTSVLQDVHSKPDIKEITVSEAKSLVEAVLQDQGHNIHSSKFELDKEEDKYFPSYYQFGASYDTPDRLIRIGTYMVDRYTAEVWDVWLCGQPKSKTMLKIQKSLRLKYGLPQEDKSKEPPCDLPDKK